jgi:cobalamin biosynthesis protein CbiG
MAALLGASPYSALLGFNKAKARKMTFAIGNFLF